LYRLSEEMREKHERRKGFESPSLLLVKTAKKEVIGVYFGLEEM